VRLRSPRPARPRPQVRRAPGQTASEVLVVLALLGIFAGLALPGTDRAFKRARLRGASRDLGLLFRRARTEAVLTRQRLGVVFERADGYSYAIYRDGNGNGIRRADIRSGVDVRLVGPVRIPERYRGVEVRIGPPPPIPRIPPEPGEVEDLDDPVKFGPTDIVSFSPEGTTSAGTVYLSIGRSYLAGVRLLGVTGRVRMWEYDPFQRRWQLLST
jgi:hypothetical protein